MYRNLLAFLFLSLSFARGISASKSKPEKDDHIDDSLIAFQVFDTDGSGTISPLELRNALRAFGYPQTLMETKALLDYGDINGNNVFEKNEYDRMLKQFGITNSHVLATQQADATNNVSRPKP